MLFRLLASSECGLLIGWLMILAVSVPVVTDAAEPDDAVSTETPSIVWDKEREGWQVGARLLNETTHLRLGVPAIVQFMLRNVSDRERTVVLREYDKTSPVVGAGNRINLNLTAGGVRHSHTIAAGETLQQPQYRVTVSTQGLPAGVYQVTSQPAFWQTKEGQPNFASGIGRAVPLRFTIGDPQQVRFTLPPDDENPVTRIHWGEPVMGLIVGMRLPQGQISWPTDSWIEAEMFIRNVSDQPIELKYEIPGVTDWNMNVFRSGGAYVRLDWVEYSGLRSHVTRSLKLAPGDQEPLTGIIAEVHIDGLAIIGREPKTETKEIPGPSLQLLEEKTEFRPGDPRRLIATQGSFEWSAWITVRQASAPDVTTVVGSSPVPFEIKADTD